MLKLNLPVRRLGKILKGIIKMDEKFSKWKGIDRTEIEWNPTVNLEKCIGCGMCITSCGRGVFGYDTENNKAVVENPYQCMVGCSSCESWCPQDAISFPDRQYRDLIKEHGLVVQARKQLMEKYGSKEKSCCNDK